MIRLVHACDNLNESRFAGAVLTEQGMNLAGMKRERDLMKRLSGVESFGDPSNLEDRRGGGRADGRLLCLGHPASARRSRR